MTESDTEKALIKKTAIENAEIKVGLCFSWRFNTSLPVKVCKLHELDMLITDLHPDDVLLHNFKGQVVVM